MTDYLIREPKRRARGIPRAATAVVLAAAAMVAAGSYLSNPVSAQMAATDGARINAANETSIPKDFRKWVFIGAPLTPNGLNGGAAGFP